MAIQTQESMDVPTYPIWRLSVEQYHEMIAAGILTDDDPVELLEGWLITKMPKKPKHSHATNFLGDEIREILPQGWFLRIQEPITMNDSEPEPDVIVIRGSRADDEERHPKPSDVALVVEVSDATLQRDRTLKLRIYAAARIPVYWILNLQDRQLEIYTDPTGLGAQASYRRRDIFAESDDAPVMIEGREVGRVKVSALV